MGLQVDENMRAEEVEIYYDPSEMFAGLLKGPLLSDLKTQKEDVHQHHSCPFAK